MSKSTESDAIPESVVLSDWAANVEGIGKSSDSVIYELMILSLLYDEILVSDEVLVLSSKLAKWLSDGNSFDPVIKLFELGSLKVLTFPESDYPKEFKEATEKARISTRANYITKKGTKDEQIFEPSEDQIAFHLALDSYLVRHPNAYRDVGSLNGLELHGLQLQSSFEQILKEVLSSEQHAKWISTAFRGLTKNITDELLNFIEDPEKAIAKIIESGKECKFVVNKKTGKPVFNRSMAYQIAEFYAPIPRRAIRELIQTAFAAPFSWNEKAVGRYGESLRELLWLPKYYESEFDREEKTVSVEAKVNFQVNLPDIRSDFVKAILHVRESEAGIQLREAVRGSGDDKNFKKQIECWNAVSYELSRFITKSKPVSVLATALSIGGSMTSGAVVKGLYEEAVKGEISIPAILGGAFLSATAAPLFKHGFKLLQNDLNRQALRSQLEQSVEFRCTPIPLPPIFTRECP